MENYDLKTYNNWPPDLRLWPWEVTTAPGSIWISEQCLTEGITEGMPSGRYALYYPQKSLQEAVQLAQYAGA